MTLFWQWQCWQYFKGKLRQKTYIPSWLVIIFTDTCTAGSVRIYSYSWDYILLHMSSLAVIHFNMALFADILQTEHATERENYSLKVMAKISIVNVWPLHQLWRHIDNNNVDFYADPPPVTTIITLAAQSLFCYWSELNFCNCFLVFIILSFLFWHCWINRLITDLTKNMKGFT